MKSFVLLVVGIASMAAADYDEVDQDLDYNDLRIGFSITPHSMHGLYKHEASGATTSDNINWTSTGRLTATWIPWPSKASESGAGLVELELSSQHCMLRSDAQHEQLDQRLVLLDLHLGLGWVPAHAWTIEFTGYMGLGSAWQSREVGVGSAYELGLRLATSRTCGPVLIGAQLAWGWQEWSSPANLNGQDYQLSFKGAGFTPGAFIGMRW